MKTIRSLNLALALTAGFVTTGAVFANEGHHHKDIPAQTATDQLVPVTDKTDAAWLAKARADYPLDSCIVSGDKFDGGDMGTPKDFIYKQDGQPDRLVRFCCKDCIKDFKQDPAKFLKVIDDAAAAKTKDGA